MDDGDSVCQYSFKEPRMSSLVTGSSEVGGFHLKYTSEEACLDGKMVVDMRFICDLSGSNLELL